MTTLRLYDGYSHTSGNLQPVVRELQAALNAEGYRVSVDGHYGPQTQAAVSQFQRARGLPVDGVATPETWAKLTGHKAPAVATFDTRYAPDDVSLRVHLHAAEAYRAELARGAVTAGLPLAIIFGVGSRESGWGTGLRPPGPGGTGDFARRSTVKPWRVGPLPEDGGGFGRGLMQIDVDSHEFARVGAWRDAAANIAYGCGELGKLRRWAEKNWSTLPERQRLRAGIAAYNCGQGNVNDALAAGRGIDFYTAHRDYSADVLERAGWFQAYGWG